MQGTVSKLCDIHSIAIPDDLVRVDIDPRCAEDALHSLSLRYAAASEVATVAVGDTVFCRADAASYPDGRTVLIFTGVSLPGAEEAAAAVLNKAVGDTVCTVLNGKTVQLTLEKIVHRTPATVDDALIQTLAIDGVSTVEDYRRHVLDKTLADAKTECCKEVNRHVIDQLIAESEFVYDETAMDQYAQTVIDDMIAQYGEEELGDDVEAAKLSVIANAKLGWLAEAFCKEQGIIADRAAAEEEADRMLEMMALMGEEVPDREELVTEALQNEYTTQLFAHIEALARKKMGE